MTQSIRDAAKRIAFNARQAMIDYGNAFKRDDNDGIRDSTTRACEAIDALIELAAPQPTADERVADLMQAVEDAVSRAAWPLLLPSQDMMAPYIAAVEQSARALLSASQEDAEHAAMYRWLRDGENDIRHIAGFHGTDMDAEIRSAMSAKETK